MEVMNSEIEYKKKPRSETGRPKIKKVEVSNMRHYTQYDKEAQKEWIHAKPKCQNWLLRLLTQKGEA